MNNSDFNDFKNWQNGDDENNPFNPHSSGFFYYGPMNDKFKDIWEKMNNGQDYTESMKDYLNMGDIFKDFSKQMKPNGFKNPNNFKKQTKRPKTTNFSQDDYLKLIEIRGYLAITEQYAHVKALDKLLNQIEIIPMKDKP